MAGRGSIHRIRRPATDTTPEFDLAYVRAGPRSATPVVVIPGGPGLASVLPYRAFRHWGASGGLDVVMVEHRGVGLSRRDRAGRMLPASAMRVRDVVDDLVAVLDAEGIDRAVIVGSSYGSYVAGAVGAWHPERVVGMLLDSALRSAYDLPLERQAVRSVFWDAGDEIAVMTRSLVDRGVDERRLLDVIRAAYELSGPWLTETLLRQRMAGHRSASWRALDFYASRDGSTSRIPFIYDFDLAGVIGFRELRYGAPLDGLPLDPALAYAAVASRFPAFEGEPLDLMAAVPGFSWPLVLMAGSRDLRTPAVIAELVAAAAPDAVVVGIDNGHSVLDSHPIALLNAVRSLVRGRQDGLPARADRLAALPRRDEIARFAHVLERITRSGDGGI